MDCKKPNVTGQGQQYIKATKPQPAGKKPKVEKGGDLRSR